MNLRGVCFFLMLLSATVSWGQENRIKDSINHIEHHIIIVIDGPRWTETYGDSTYQYIPNIGKILQPKGTLFTNFRNNGPTYTNSGHTAITTGVHQKIPNDGSKLPKKPSIFQYVMKQQNLKKEDVWILTSKGKLEMLANTKDNTWWNTYMPSTYCGVNGQGVGYPSDEKMYPKFKEIILEHNPKLTLVNLLNIDVWGHQNNWEKYIESHLLIDSLVMDLYNAVEKDPEMKGRTAYYITNDHGRHLDGHKDGFKSHGDGCEGCRHISLLAIGPGFEANKKVSCAYDQIDLTATLAYLLGIEMPTGKGCPIPELTQKHQN